MDFFLWGPILNAFAERAPTLSNWISIDRARLSNRSAVRGKIFSTTSRPIWSPIWSTHWMDSHSSSVPWAYLPTYTYVLGGQTTCPVPRVVSAAAVRGPTDRPRRWPETKNVVIAAARPTALARSLPPCLFLILANGGGCLHGADRADRARMCSYILTILGLATGS